MTKSQITDIEFLSKTRKFYQDEISFAGRGLKLNKKEDVKELVDAILNQKCIKVLRLEGNTISPEAAQELGMALQKHPELERFIGNDIFTGRLKDEIPLALKSICGSFDKSGCHLVEINMSDNAFGPIGLDALVSFFESACCFSLKEIRMHNNGLGPEGAKKFALAMEKCYQNSKGTFKLRVFVCGRNRLEYEGSKNISNTLKQIGSLEEIQMPQNGIRPNGIEFIAEAMSFNKNLRVINLNDNTFRKIGGEWMAKALCCLENLEYLNFGDCLLRSKGAILIARSLTQAKKLKEVILSFNEININAGFEIAKILVSKSSTLTLLDLNGNKFGEEGKMDIAKILEPLGNALCSLSEDEGSDEEEEEQDEDALNDEEDEEEEAIADEDNIEVVDDEDYEQVGDNYDDYNEGEDEDDESYNEEGYDDEEGQENKYGSSNIVQSYNQQKPLQPSLFTNFKFDQLNLNNNNHQQPESGQAPNNFFSNMVKNNSLITHIKLFDQFIIDPNEANLYQIDEATLNSVTQNSKFNGHFLIRFLANLSKLYNNHNSNPIEVNEKLLNCANHLTGVYLANESNMNRFADEILTEFGLLKCEDKSFRPIEFTDNLCKLFEQISKQSYFSSSIKETISNYINFRNVNMTGATFNQTFKKISDHLIKSFS